MRSASKEEDRSPSSSTSKEAKTQLHPSDYERHKKQVMAMYSPRRHQERSISRGSSNSSRSLNDTTRSRSISSRDDSTSETKSRRRANSRSRLNRRGRSRTARAAAREQLKESLSPVPRTNNRIRSLGKERNRRERSRSSKANVENPNHGGVARTKSTNEITKAKRSSRRQEVIRSKSDDLVLEQMKTSLHSNSENSITLDDDNQETNGGENKLSSSLPCIAYKGSSRRRSLKSSHDSGNIKASVRNLFHDSRSMEIKNNNNKKKKNRSRKGKKEDGDRGLMRQDSWWERNPTTSRKSKTSPKRNRRSSNSPGAIQKANVRNSINSHLQEDKKQGWPEDGHHSFATGTSSVSKHSASTYRSRSSNSRSRSPSVTRRSKDRVSLSPKRATLSPKGNKTKTRMSIKNHLQHLESTASKSDDCRSTSVGTKKTVSTNGSGSHNSPSKSPKRTSTTEQSPKRNPIKVKAKARKMSITSHLQSLPGAKNTRTSFDNNSLQSGFTNFSEAIFNPDDISKAPDSAMMLNGEDGFEVVEGEEKINTMSSWKNKNEKKKRKKKKSTTEAGKATKYKPMRPHLDQVVPLNDEIAENGDKVRGASREDHEKKKQQNKSNTNFSKPQLSPKGKRSSDYEQRRRRSSQENMRKKQERADRKSNIWSSLEFQKESDVDDDSFIRQLPLRRKSSDDANDFGVDDVPQTRSKSLKATSRSSRRQSWWDI